MKKGDGARDSHKVEGLDERAGEESWAKWKEKGAETETNDFSSGGRWAHTHIQPTHTHVQNKCSTLHADRHTHSQDSFFKPLICFSVARSPSNSTNETKQRGEEERRQTVSLASE